MSFICLLLISSITLVRGESKGTHANYSSCFVIILWWYFKNQPEGRRCFENVILPLIENRCIDKDLVFLTRNTKIFPFSKITAYSYFFIKSISIQYRIDFFFTHPKSGCSCFSCFWHETFIQSVFNVFDIFRLLACLVLKNYDNT